MTEMTDDKIEAMAKRFTEFRNKFDAAMHKQKDSNVIFEALVKENNELREKLHNVQSGIFLETINSDIVDHYKELNVLHLERLAAYKEYMRTTPNELGTSDMLRAEVKLLDLEKRLHRKDAEFWQNAYNGKPVAIINNKPKASYWHWFLLVLSVVCGLTIGISI